MTSGAVEQTSIGDGPSGDSDLALVLSGGGARAAYQVGFLRYLGSRYPELSPGILTGVSAGGIMGTGA